MLSVARQRTVYRRPCTVRVMLEWIKELNEVSGLSGRVLHKVGPRGTFFIRHPVCMERPDLTADGARGVLHKSQLK